MKHKTCSTCKELVPIEGFHKNLGFKAGINSRCKKCANLKNTECYHKNREARLKYAKEFVEANREKVLKQKKEYYEKIKLLESYKEKMRQYSKKYQIENKEKVREIQRNWYATSTRAKSIGAEKSRRRRTCKVKWANDFFISEIYHLAQLRSRLLGVKYHVDHIIPLKHPLVCGLHVENNLQIITQHENCVKRNKFNLGYV